MSIDIEQLVYTFADEQLERAQQIRLHPDQCPDCHGTGTVTVTNLTVDGVLHTQEPCTCGGAA